MTQTIAELSNWPKTEAEVTVDAILRTVGVAAQRTWLEKWAKLTARTLTPEQHIDMVESVLGAVGFMMVLRRLRDVDATKGQEFAVDYWNMCEAGDSVGELLWQYLEDTGIDPSLIVLPVTAGAVDPAADGTTDVRPRATPSSSSSS